MSQGFFTNLEPEITMDILSRLPTRTIAHCKCVCKPWLGLLETDQFAKHHLPKSLTGLAVRRCLRSQSQDLCQVYEYEDVLDLDNHEVHYNLVTGFNLSIPGMIHGSASGLLLLRDLATRPVNSLYVCNPITRDCIQINCPQHFAYYYPQVVSFGFGTSRTSFQHKVVRVFHDCLIEAEPYKLLGVRNYECHVYTIGSGSWRSVAPGAPLIYSCRSIGAYLNGNLHWLVTGLDRSRWISCFDLETELFHSFSAPPPGDGGMLMDVFALDGCLCVCDNSSYDEIVIWTMEEYGIQNSWTKKFVISKIPDFDGESYDLVQPIKVFKDGDILMAWQDWILFYYSNKTKTLKRVDTFEEYNLDSMESIPHTSSFLSLKCFTMENLISL